MPPPIDLDFPKSTGGGAGVADPLTTIPGMLFWNDPAAAFLMKDGAELVSKMVDRYAGHEWGASGTQRPAFELGANGQPALRVAGAQKMDCIDGLAELVDQSAPYTFVSVVEWDNTTDTQVVLGLGRQAADTNSYRVNYVQNNSAPLAIQFYSEDGGGSTANNTTTPVGASLAQQAWLYTGAAMSFRIGVVAILGGANTRAPVCDLATLFAGKYAGVYSSFAKGLFYESFAWDHILTGSEWAIVDARNTQKYGGI